MGRGGGGGGGGGGSGDGGGDVNPVTQAEKLNDLKKNKRLENIFGRVWSNTERLFKNYSSLILVLKSAELSLPTDFRSNIRVHRLLIVSIDVGASGNDKKNGLYSQIKMRNKTGSVRHIQLCQKMSPGDVLLAGHGSHRLILQISWISKPFTMEYLQNCEAGADRQVETLWK
jgi:hypothetical protein